MLTVQRKCSGHIPSFCAIQYPFNANPNLLQPAPIEYFGKAKSGLELKLLILMKNTEAYLIMDAFGLGAQVMSLDESSLPSL